LRHLGKGGIFFFSWWPFASYGWFQVRIDLAASKAVEIIRSTTELACAASSGR
jgi:hypothetical protein